MSDLVNEAVEINGVKVLYKDFENKDIDELKSLIDIAKQKLKSCVVIFGSNNDKAIFVAGVTKDLTSKYHSGNIVKVAANFAGGNGGGRPDFAQAGGKDGKLTKDAINAAIEYIKGL